MTKGLEKIKQLYETGRSSRTPADFYLADPIGFPKRFKREKDIETAAFIAAMFAIGPRYTILRSLEKIFSKLGPSPYDAMLNFDHAMMTGHMEGHIQFAYKNITGRDAVQILFAIGRVIRSHGSVERALKALALEREFTSYAVLAGLLEEMKSVKLPSAIGGSMTPRAASLLASPRQGSACKRMNMFLRWMTRKDEIDFGFYDWLGTDKLIIPLDVNVSRAARYLDLTKRKTDNWKTAAEITEKLKSLDPSDPVKYDVPLFLYGMELRKGGHAL